MWTAWMWVSGAIMFYVPFFAMTNIVNQDGKVGSLWVSGITSFTILIASHHGSVFIGTRNYTLPLVIMYIFSFLCFCPITILINDYDPTSNTYHTVFSEIFGGTPLFWLCIIFSIGTILMPIYLAKAYEMIIKSPEFYQHKSQE